MKRLLLLPLLALCLSCSDNSGLEPAPRVTPIAYSGDFRAGNWHEPKASVLGKEAAFGVSPVSDEGDLVIMGFNRRNQYDVYEFKDNQLVGGLVVGGSASEEKTRLTKAHGNPIETTAAYTRWLSAKSSVTLFHGDGSVSTYYTPR